MFQTFEVTTRPDQGPPRLASLRASLAAAGLDACLVPHADAWQGEYLAPCDERLAWLTGFTGSAGFAVITHEKAGVFIDGRYRLQVQTQVAPDFTPVPWPEVKLADWLIEEFAGKGREEGDVLVGYDPWLHTVDELRTLEKALSPQGISLRPGPNLIDPLWTDRPPRPDAPFFAWPEEFGGEDHGSKRARLARSLRDAGQSAAILTQPDSIAWLLNIRGADIPRNPVPQSFALLHGDGRVSLFALPGKAAALSGHFGDEVSVVPEDAFLPALDALEGPVRLYPKTAPRAVLDRLVAAGVEVVFGTDPCLLPKACKTEVEIAGTREAHLRDAVAMIQFLAWLDEEAPKGQLTEIATVRALEAFRRATNALRDISFETIAGSGPNGAIVHYRVTEETDRAIAPGDLLLVDSGGQYLDGTTDITRTIAVGPPPDEAPACYTRVLRGMIAISRARFPKGVTGAHLDALARYPLWLAGQDYDHGTGHGVGVYLSVHEGPQRLSRVSDVVLEPGMILSNEPGYYRAGAFGIRIENLIVVREAPSLPGADDREMRDFETLTYVPFDRRLILAGMLSQEERAWIDAYHAEVRRRVGPRVEGPARDWLEAACAPL